MAWKLYEGDCFDYFHLFEDKSIDMILCDLPYGTTACKWDTPLPLDRLWKEYKRLIKDNGAIVLTGSQPFTTVLINSNLKLFSHCWYWIKSSHSNPFIAKFQPLRIVEEVCVFSNGTVKYNPQEMIKTNKKARCCTSDNYHWTKKGNYTQTLTNYPKNTLNFDNEKGNIHPTQKPVKLFEYLIKTYTNENDLVLDNCAGSGTTGVACEITNRNSILIEKEPEYCEIIRERLSDINMEEYQPQRVHKPLTAF